MEYLKEFKKMAYNFQNFGDQKQYYQRQNPHYAQQSNHYGNYGNYFQQNAFQLNAWQVFMNTFTKIISYIYPFEILDFGLQVGLFKAEI